MLKAGVKKYGSLVLLDFKVVQGVLFACRDNRIVKREIILKLNSSIVIIFSAENEVGTCLNLM